MNVPILANKLKNAVGQMQQGYVIMDWQMLEEAAILLTSQQDEINALKAQAAGALSSGKLAEIEALLRAQQEQIEALKADPLMFMRLNPKQELTDAEIMSEWEESKDEVDFARAILRKALKK